jgi:hypothetical protein
MRLTTNKCAKNDCNNSTRAGFRFCHVGDCRRSYTSHITPKVNDQNEEE